MSTWSNYHLDTGIDITEPWILMIFRGLTNTLQIKIHFTRQSQYAISHFPDVKRNWNSLKRTNQRFADSCRKRSDFFRLCRALNWNCNDFSCTATLPKISSYIVQIPASLNYSYFENNPWIYSTLTSHVTGIIIDGVVFKVNSLYLLCRFKNGPFHIKKIHLVTSFCEILRARREYEIELKSGNVKSGRCLVCWRDFFNSVV